MNISKLLPHLNLTRESGHGSACYVKLIGADVHVYTFANTGECQHAIDMGEIYLLIEQAISARMHNEVVKTNNYNSHTSLTYDISGKACGRHVVYWRTSGNTRLIMSEGTYYNGEPHGTHRRWHENGQLHTYTSYCYGKRTGVELTWTEAGVLVFRANNTMGQRTGLVETWHGNGQPHTRGEYVFNPDCDTSIPHGEHYEWDEDGSLISHANYDTGELHGERHDYTYGDEPMVTITRYQHGVRQDDN